MVRSTDKLDTEEGVGWRRIFGHYLINNRGVIKGKRGVLTPDVSSGYARITLYNKGQPKKYLVHRLVAEAFLVRVEGLDQVNHLDGNKLNNDVRNLEWSNQSLNQKHAYRMGLQVGYRKPTPLSESHKKSFCGSRWAGETRLYLAGGLEFKSPEDCADHFKINRQTVYNRVKSSKYQDWSIIIVKEVEDE